MGRADHSFPLGERWPAGPDEGADERRITPVGTLISLALLDSFPLEGGSHYGREKVNWPEGPREAGLGRDPARPV